MDRLKLKGYVELRKDKELVAAGENLVVFQGYLWFLQAWAAWPHWSPEYHADEFDPLCQPPNYGPIADVIFGNSEDIVDENQTGLQGSTIFSYVNASEWAGPNTLPTPTKYPGTDGWGFDVNMHLDTYTGIGTLVKECGIFTYDGAAYWMIARFLVGDVIIEPGVDIDVAWKIRVELNNG